MRRQACLIGMLVAGAIVAACNSTEHATAPRPRFAAGTAPYDSAVMNAPWAQEIKGWGAYAVGELPANQSAYTTMLQMNLTFIRDKIDCATIYDSGTTMTDMVLDTVVLDEWIAKWHTAKAAGLGYVLSIWSPPAQFKTNGSCSGDLGGTRDSTRIGYLKFADVPAFAVYVTKVMQYLAKSSVGLPMALSIQNEPNKDVSYDGCQYVDTVYQYALKQVHYDLSTNGVNVTLLAPETSNYGAAITYLGPNSFEDLTNDAYLDSSVNAYAWHSYTQCEWPDAAAGVAAHPKDAWMSEFANPTGGHELAWALQTFGIMGADLVLVPNNYWAWFLGWGNTSSPPDSSNLMTGQGPFNFSKRYLTFKKLWQMVRPGWSVKTFASMSDTSVHITASQTDCNPVIQMVAFSDAKNDTTVVLIVNTTSNDKSIRINTFPPNFNAQNSWRSDSTSDTIPQAGSNVFDGYSTVQVPHRSIVIAKMFPQAT